MADNRTAPFTGSGDATAVIATDDLGGIHYQRVKLVWGVDGVATDASAANPLPVVQTAAAQPIPAGTNVIGYVGLAPRASGGLSVSRVVSAATTNATVVKASAGQVFGWYLSNINASPRYVKLFNKATAPTVGTDAPTLTLLVPAGGAANCEFTNGIAFSTGIGFATTTAAADADTGAVAAAEVIVHILYA